MILLAALVLGAGWILNSPPITDRASDQKTVLGN
jgi:hypothetical protein